MSQKVGFLGNKIDKPNFTKWYKAQKRQNKKWQGAIIIQREY